MRPPQPDCSAPRLRKEAQILSKKDVLWIDRAYFVRDDYSVYVLMVVSIYVPVTWDSREQMPSRPRFLS